MEGKGKAQVADARENSLAKLAKEIQVAARVGPAGNARLRLVVEQARRCPCQDTLDAIKEGCAGLAARRPLRGM